MKEMRILFYIVLVLCMVGCKKKEEHHDPGKVFMSQCGVVHEGMLKNPVAIEEGRSGHVEIADYNLVVIHLPEGSVLVKLQGIEGMYGYAFRTLAMNKLREIAGDGQAVFYQAMPDCTVRTSGGGVAAVGSLFTIDGVNYVEELLKTGYVEADRYDYCSGELVGECLKTIEETAPEYSDYVVSDFLWKPVSDKDGNLTVLLNPYGATIYVNGIKLADSGSGNGRGTIARGRMPGCNYGGNVQVKVYDDEGRIILFPDGSETYIIPNGCQRYEF